MFTAKAEGKVLASERIKAYRKDVLSKGGKGKFPQFRFGFRLSLFLCQLTAMLLLICSRWWWRRDKEKEVIGKTERGEETHEANRKGDFITRGFQRSHN